MTAEIVIMNDDAVAMASDSVVTIGTEDFDEKTYPSANKLFSISYDLPIGIMTYGNGKFMNISWETLIKMYRTSSKKSFSNLKECVFDFINFLENIREFDEEKQKNEILDNFSIFHYQILKNIISAIRYENNGRQEDAEKSNLEKSNRLNQPVENINTLIQNILFDEIDNVKKSEPYFFIEKDFENDQQFLCNLREDFKEILEKNYGKIYDTFKDLIDELTESYFKHISDYNFSGIIISGFGSDEIFPKTYSLMMREIRNGKVVYTIEEKKGTGVYPFAQTDMVDLFMKGVSPETYANLCLAIENKFPDICKDIFETMANSIDDDIDNTNQLIENLPKSELAFMAETLVNLTSFKRMFSIGMETVGGPVDVAVISKGDGFIWIKRKHYFKPELNPHFIAHYYNKRLEEQS
ncbi:hypothetical protein MsAg5_07280 [Methanosarcinaceae archaeon Ag5]|uniref:Uncharacterized protein n=1 Tax=Methanolapillus africanus TaxID=3028297 RepID=A0AAE4MJ19_9EURY|nr:hypothetical protein [Methanosarcinaceae archaeon Ag5]